MHSQVLCSFTRAFFSIINFVFVERFICTYCIVLIFAEMNQNYVGMSHFWRDFQMAWWASYVLIYDRFKDDVKMSTWILTLFTLIENGVAAHRKFMHATNLIECIDFGMCAIATQKCIFRSDFVKSLQVFHLRSVPIREHTYTILLLWKLDLMVSTLQQQERKINTQYYRQNCILLKRMPQPTHQIEIWVAFHSFHLKFHWNFSACVLFTPHNFSIYSSFSLCLLWFRAPFWRW